jgi:hypothetical protein
VAWCPYISADNDRAPPPRVDPGLPEKLGTVAQTFTVANQAAPALGPGGWLAATVPAAGCHLPGAAAGPVQRTSRP